MRTTVAAVVLCTVAASVSAQATSGVYFYGHETESFYPCGSDKAYWVVGRQGVLHQIRRKADHLRTSEEPYPPLFVQAVGRPEGKDTTSGGFAEQYDAVFRVSRVLKVSALVPASCTNRGLTHRSSRPLAASAELRR
jgi:hypothetical protein